MSVNEGDINRIASSVVNKLDERLAGHSGSPPGTIEALGRQFPKLKEALYKLGAYELVKVHDDGDLTVRARGKEYVVTTNGQVFEQKSQSGSESGKPTKKHLPTRDQVRVERWEERDRLHIGIQDKETGDYYMSWWDDQAREMFEDGFFKSGRGFEESVLSYAEDIGILAK
jgi:hypothetical protein